MTVFSLRSLGYIALFLLLAWLVVVGLGPAVLPLVLSFFVAYLVFPAIVRLEKFGINRAVSVSAVFLLIVLICLGLLAAIIPSLLFEARRFLTELPAMGVTAAERIERLLLDFGLPVVIDQESVREMLLQYSNSLSLSALKPMGLLVSRSVAGVLGSVLGLLNLFLFPLFFFYIILDYERIVRQLSELIPKQYRPGWQKFEEHVGEVFSGYIRGQILVAFILSLLYAIGLGLAGVKFGVLIGLIAGLLNIIPYVGFLLGFGTAMIVTLADYSGIGSVLVVVLVFAIVQTLEGFVITPKLVGDKVGLSSFITMLALIVGGNAGGLVGILMAIPIAAIAKRVLCDVRESYFRSDLYNGSSG